ncbi:LANO_0E00386g1_1 [Lachancea nothofagi CBS 11611]|uniref:Glucose-6-phosphate 1-dehydrogenase n=1 Tax=Lachancea nothofagi CBS 11611 TaxID=1266666 RepID=A0A1G4JNU8_9SACH|nr:LANO_0E00386g1_1 [Lachancea nothofagi CBS 11611]
MSSHSQKPVEFKENTSIVVFGASGDLSKKKTFPALFGLFREGFLDESCRIIGFARSKLSDDDLRGKIEPNLKKPNGDKDSEKVKQFLKMVSYMSGPYDQDEGYETLAKELEAHEEKNSVEHPHRLFYLALPPSAFVTVCTQIKKNVYAKDGDNRVVVEKPFGHDLDSFRELQNDITPLFREDELFRIDHYLGKEMVKNLVLMRFANTFLSSAWNKENIEMMQISFKEPFGTEGRGGYFDDIGIIRDVMQNHLLQILTLLTMERPVSFDAESVRDEKVRVLKAFAPIEKEDILIGQYGKSEDGSKPGYLDDDTVDPDSKCVTFAALGFKIQNERWDGVPFVMRAGKALNEGKVEIRVQFKGVPSGIFSDISRNELVIRVQPDEAIYLKCNSKTPGLSTTCQVTELDLTYSRRYKDYWIPEAYESLIKDVMMGDHSNFVRDDELDVSWKLFTPLLKYLEGPDAPKPEEYAYGSRGPKNLVSFLENHKYEFEDNNVYQWPVATPDMTSGLSKM